MSEATTAGAERSTGSEAWRGVTVVSGIPRSGTSLGMAMLEAAGIAPLVDEVRPADAGNPRGYYEYEPVRRTRRDASWVDQAEGRAVKVIHALVQALPTDRRYRVVLMRRDMAEVLASQARMLERGRARPGVVDQRGLAEILGAQLEEVRGYLAREPAFDALELDYGALMRHPEPVVAGLASFLGRPEAAGAMRAVIDPALYRERAARTTG